MAVPARSSGWEHLLKPSRTGDFAKLLRALKSWGDGRDLCRPNPRAGPCEGHAVQQSSPAQAGSVPWGAAPLTDPAPPEGRGSTDGAG